MRRFLRPLIASLLVALGSAPGNAADVWTGASWVWDNPGAATNAGNDPIFVRHEFELPAAPVSATIKATADNIYELYLNGEKLGGDAAWESAESYDVAKQLVAGKNVIAVRAQNQGSPAGLIVRMEFKLPGGKTQVIGSGGKWRVANAEADGWTKPGFDDRKWLAASVLGGADIGPWNLASRGGSGSGGGSQDNNVSDTKITAYRPASEQIANFVLPEGFKIELLVAEPTVINPVCIAFDDAGHLYVSESHTYRYGPSGSPVKAPPNPIVRLTRQSDGTYGERVVVAEGFEDPVMGMLVKDGQLWAAANNFLYRFDLTDAGPATNKKVLLVDKNKAWNPFGMFVLEWGPEGDLYLSVGNHDIDLGPEGHERGKGVGGRGGSGIVVRMKPDGSQIERLVHGLRVPYSFEYDPFGQLWLLSNGEGNPNRFVRVIDGVDYHCYSRGVSNDWLAGRHPLAPPCFELPRGACTQLERYYGANFPAAYQGSLLLDNWGAHGFQSANRTIYRYVPDDRNNIETKEEFIVCRDPHFRCSHLLNAADGSLLVADWYGRDDESDVTGRIWRVHYDGPEKISASAVSNGAFGDTAKSIGLLDHADERTRERAIDALVKLQGEKFDAPLLSKAATEASPMAAANALWTLVRIGKVESLAAIASGTKNADWRVRRLALRLLRRYDVEGRDAVAQQLAGDNDPAVQLEAAFTRTDATTKRAAIIAALKAGAAEDDHLRYEAAWHLADVADRASLEGLLGGDANLQIAGLVAIDVAGYENRASMNDAMAVLAAKLVEPGEIEPAWLFQLAELHNAPPLVDALRQIVANSDVPPAVTGKALLLLRSKAGAEKFDATAVQRFLKAVEEGEVQIQSTSDWLTLLELLETAGPSEFAIGQIGRALTHGDGNVRSAAHRLARTFAHEASPVAGVLWERVLNSQDNRQPAEKLEDFATILAVESPPSVEHWTKLLREGNPLLVTDAVRSWRQFAGQAEMLKLVSDVSPDLIKRQPELRDDFASIAAALALESALKAQIELPELPANDEAYQTAAAASTVDAPHAALGRRVFERAGCVKCHTTVTQTSERAPSLAGIGQAQKLPYLVESVLAPSTVIKTGFETETIVATDGAVYSGLVKEEGDKLRIISADKIDLLPKSDVDERSVQKKSLMPDNQHRALSRSEFADLMSYLQSLK